MRIGFALYAGDQGLHRRDRGRPNASDSMASDWPAGRIEFSSNFFPDRTVVKSLVIEIKLLQARRKAFFSILNHCVLKKQKKKQKP